ncbi:MAG: amidotransferase 1, exosortase A system-associated [Gammaproteobacteria bacterium]|nr:amidotransferase 1, exosortase A system-associated [Gammaproteobacteria bacterium]NND60397.1 amidotransferase 1, exosortase A system-associated [Gammaproteobacteria bacterium]
MCGIAGIIDVRTTRTVDAALLQAMNNTLDHRGPDAEGWHIVPGAGLAHRRLSIIDLEGGKQPLFNEDGTVAVTYNGEIYNFAELREELLAAGHQFRTRSDTEVIVHAWEQWGEQCVTRFNGMFAFAIWDQNRDTVFLARDRIGIKPLYYSFLPGGWLIFGSELKALLRHPQLQREIDQQAVADFFTFGYIPDPRTILRNVSQLSPGHTLKQRRGENPAQQRQYWDVVFSGDYEAQSAEALCEELRERLQACVQRRLIAEVPLGAFLSGGVDSSAVVATMAGLSPDPVNTCAIGFDVSGYDESRFASQVAQQYQTNHHHKVVDPDDFGLVHRLADFYDEPFADSSAMPTYRVCELARKHVTVALSGDGGDENFAGYRRHRWHAWEEKIRAPLPGRLRSLLFGTAGRIYPKLDWAPQPLRAKSTLEALGRDSLAAYLHSVSILGQRERDGLFASDFRRQLGGYDSIEVFRRHAAAGAVEDPLSMVQYLDFKTYLPGDILTKVDRASMAHSLEVRVPLLDHEFVEWVATLSSSLKLRGREGKYIFKKALEPMLPSDILYRPKMGFAVPIVEWFRGPLRDHVRESILGESLADAGIFDRQQLQWLVDQHLSGKRNFAPSIWALLMFAQSHERLFGNAEATQAVTA